MKRARWSSQCGGVPRHFHFHGSETAGITAATSPDLATPPLNGHKAPVRNLRVEALTAWQRSPRPFACATN
ncbi:unnamed protein product [Lasius platythorax]|uniref:Uncharacterized protein n=1 Tax=Lasius platythorax TaxID=488582 RepID=A0AAV2P466_9HYME